MFSNVFFYIHLYFFLNKNSLCRYASDHAENGYKAYCQAKLLNCLNVEAQLVRTYPPSQLEYQANKRCANMALDVNFVDGGLSLNSFYIYIINY